MAQWYCTIDGQETGPYGGRELKAMAGDGRLRPTDYVWKEGMGEWVAAGAVRGLFDAMPEAAQPAPADPVTEPPVAAAAPRAVPADPGPFTMLHTVFRVNGTTWGGPVLLSPSALYFAKVQRKLPGLAAAALETPEDLRTCYMTDLPGNVRHILQQGEDRSSASVIVLPREAVRLVKTSFFNATLKILAGPDRFLIPVPGNTLVGRLRRAFRDYGWTVNREVTPTAEVTHGHGRGRATDLPVAGRKVTPFMRVVYILLVVAAILAFVLIRVVFRAVVTSR